METNQDQEHLQEQTKEVWKTFGRDTDVGKILFSLYKTGKPAQINYPKPKTKKFDPNPPKEQKPCPQKQLIDYPEEPKPEYTFDKMLMVPKKKNQNVIQKEIDEYYAKPYIPINRGKDRNKMINQLQQKFKYSTGVLPEKASMPISDQDVQKILNDPKIKELAQQRLKKQNYKDLKESENQRQSDEEQLNTLFQQILEEIEERQQFLEFKEPELKKRIKQEIVERVSELQKVTELQQKIVKR